MNPVFGKRRRLAAILGFLVCGSLAAVSFWCFQPYFGADPMKVLERQTPARVWLDRDGNIVRRERTYDAQWRFDVPLSAVSPEVIRVILAAEDARFYSHSGVDLFAMARAVFQNVTGTRILSGASTITMQLASLSAQTAGEKRIHHSFPAKFRQILRARRMEKLYSKERILQEYLNRIPFGGKICGIEAAALYYFGLPASELNTAEAALLCGIPQRPNLWRPDRNPQGAKKRQKRVLALLERRGFLAPGEAVRIAEKEPLRLRDFKYPSCLAGPGGNQYDMFFRHARKEAPDRFLIRTSLEPSVSGTALAALKAHAENIPGIRDGACVILDNRSMEVLACIGTLDPASPFAGEVDAAFALRSAGSTLKPFFYAEGIEGGLISRDTVLMDSPLRYQDYEPENFDRFFRGRVTVETALRDSLNLPAVRVLAMLGEKRVLRVFRSLHLMEAGSRKENGLSLALGSAGHTLFGLTRAFAVFPNGGEFRQASFLAGGGRRDGHRIWHRGTCGMICRILRNEIPPFAGMDAAWKTGTSNGNHDAWCLASTPEYTVGVWFGNKDGKGSVSLTGIHCAAPCAAGILRGLYRRGRTPSWRENSFSQMEKLCRETGLRKGVNCTKDMDGLTVKGIPLQVCRQCKSGGKKERMQILSPRSGTYLLPPGKKFLSLPVAANRPGALFYIDGCSKGKFHGEYPFSAGEHTVIAMDPSDAGMGTSVKFQVFARH